MIKVGTGKLEKKFIQKMMGERFDEFWGEYEELFPEQRKELRALIYQFAEMDGSKIEAVFEREDSRCNTTTMP